MPIKTNENAKLWSDPSADFQSPDKYNKLWNKLIHLFHWQSDSVSEWVGESLSHSKKRVDWCDPGEWRYLLKTLLMRLWQLMILMEIILEVAIWVMDMEDDKVADMLLKFPYEDFTLSNMWLICDCGYWWYHNTEMMIDRFISSQYMVKHFQSHLVFFPDLWNSMVITDLLPGAPFFSFLFLQWWRFPNSKY